MKVREMLNVQVPICKVCQGALSRVMVYRDDYKGHLYFCKDCGTEYKIIGQGQAENELLMEYENCEKFMECGGLKKKDCEFWDKVAEELKPTIKRALEETFEPTKCMNEFVKEKSDG